MFDLFYVEASFISEEKRVKKMKRKDMRIHVAFCDKCTSSLRR